MQEPNPSDRPRVPAPTIEAWEKWYVSTVRRARGRAPSDITLRSKRQQLGGIQRRLDAQFAPTPPNLVELLTNRGTMNEFLNALEADVTNGTVCNYLAALQSYADMACPDTCVLQRSDYPGRNPAPAITVYSDDEMKLLTGAAWAHGVRWGAFINTIATTGRRVGEVLRFEWPWFRLDEDPAYIELPMSKNGRPQYIPLGDFLTHEVYTPERVAAMKQVDREYKNRDARLHPFPWGYTAANHRLHTMCRQLGVECRGFHNFRHTVITNRLAQGVPIQAVAALAGHSSIATTDRRYNHTTALHFADYV